MESYKTVHFQGSYQAFLLVSACACSSSFHCAFNCFLLVWFNWKRWLRFNLHCGSSLFEGQCEHLQPKFNIGESYVFLQDAGKASTEVSDTVSLSAPSSISKSDCMLLNTLSTPTLDPDIAMLDPATASPSHDIAKKKRRTYNLNWHFQDNWVAKMPWAEAIKGANRQVT